MSSPKRTTIVAAIALTGAMAAVGCSTNATDGSNALHNGATPTAAQQQSSDNPKGTPDIGSGGTGTAGTGTVNGSTGTGGSSSSGGR
jgi:hypothetical protein